MQFYKVTGKIQGKGNKNQGNRMLDDEWKQEVQEATSEFVSRLGDKEAVFPAFFRGPMFSIGVAADSLSRAEEIVSEYMNSLNFPMGKRSFEEQTFESFRKLVGFSERRGFLGDGCDILENLGIAGLERCGRYGLYFGENLLADSTKKKCRDGSAHYMMETTLDPELDRIYAEQGNTVVQGHPVHYMLQTDSLEVRREVCRILLSALYGNGRIRNRRYIFTDISADGKFSQKFLSDLYESAGGGAIILRFPPDNDTEEEEYADAQRDMVEEVSKVVNEFRHKVLTILCFPRECTKLWGYFQEDLSRMSFVTLSEDMVSGARAKSYLRMLCRERGVKADKALYSKVEGGDTFLAEELKNLFSEWFDRKLKKDCYPQYREIGEEREKVAREKPKGTASEELEEMIGLKEAKRVMKEALDYYKAHKVFRDKGMRAERPSLHMVFTGNPGSAKTSTARLFARIMRDNGILSKGHFMELSRADLVGKYVGWTAKIVQKKFKEAEGGCLLIDEAYSLCDDSNSFAMEAINTICMEMENHRDDCVVIFAGYPDKMEEFLSRNPGLRSRIAFHVNFEDYSRDELLDIARLMCRKKGISLTVGAQKKLGEIFEIARKDSDFGNGRFARNIIESSQMAQASRLLQMDINSVTQEDVATITEEDIHTPEAVLKENTRAIGFCS